MKLPRLIELRKPLTVLAVTVSGMRIIAQAQDEDSTELAKELANPIASLISVPFQNNVDLGIGPNEEGWRYTLNIQPVIPISLNSSWNLIVRTIIPYVHQDDVFKANAPIISEDIDGIPVDVTSEPHPARVQDGLGDILQSFFLSPKTPAFGRIIWGLGPVFLYPSATDPLLGSEKWGAGPTLVALVQQKGWTVGGLFNQIWSFAGDQDRTYVNATFFQPFIAYTTKTSTTFTLNSESTYDWRGEQWTVPINFIVSQVFKVGKQPVSLQVGGRYYFEAPNAGPNWGARLNFTLLFPITKRPASATTSSYSK